MEFRDLLLLVWRHKKIIVGIPLLTGVICISLLQTVSPIYQTDVTIMIKGLKYPSWQPAIDNAAAEKELAKTYSELIRSDSFLLNLVKILPFQSDLAALRRNIRCQLSEEENLIRITVKAQSPTKAVQTVNGIVELLPAIVEELFGSREMLVIERGVVNKVTPRGNGSLLLGLIMTISLLWVLSVLMFKANIILEEKK